MPRWLIVFATVCASCGDSVPSPANVAPSSIPAPGPATQPAPTPSQPIFSGRVTETLTGATIPSAAITSTAGISTQADSTGTFAFEGPSTTARVTVTASGYISRETTISAGRPTTIDLIRNAAPFSLEFYRQLARGTNEFPSVSPLFVLSDAPSFYLRSSGLSSRDIETIAETARTIVPAFTGMRLAVARFEVGSELRSDQQGWIVIEPVSKLQNDYCGFALIGATAGHIQISTATECLAGGTVNDGLVAHEIGHALGFYHLDFRNALMFPAYQMPHKTITDGERYHGAVAYTRIRGNRDIDVDPEGSGPRFATDRRLFIFD